MHIALPDCYVLASAEAVGATPVFKKLEEEMRPVFRRFEKSRRVKFLYEIRL
ncbi:MAG: hypothetical protein GSR85_08300 [Desulfurococcales archaeon]|nr:hypothetical protein [Desulfurococcales archaeon]